MSTERASSPSTTVTLASVTSAEFSRALPVRRLAAASENITTADQGLRLVGQRFVGRNAPAVPWPHAVDLDLEGEAQDHANEHDGPEDDDALHGLVDHDRADDVGDDEHFEAEQDHPAEVLAQVAERVLTARGDDLTDVTSKRAESPDDQNRRPDSLDDVHDVGEEFAIRHGAAESATRLRDPASFEAWVVHGVAHR